MKNISIIIPAKDEEARLPGFLRTVIDFCRRSAHSYEIIVVDDGSRDRTAVVSLSFQKEFPSLRVISLERNHGKGYAVKQGFFAAKGEIVLFLDADGSTGPQEIERHLECFDQGYDIVIGSRVLNDGETRVKTLAYRKLIGKVFNLLVSSILIKNIKDTQCGFKMFRASIVPAIFGRVYLEGFGFDLEILYLAQKMNFRIKEVAVNWSHVDGSKVDLFRDSLQMFWNVIQIKNWHFVSINTEAEHMSAKELTNMFNQEKGHWWFKAKGEFFREILSRYDLDGKFILDAGCGTGHNMEFLRSRGFYVGCDVSPEALQYCRINGVQRLVRGNLHNLGFRSKAFDVVISLDVLEHVADQVSVLAEFKRVLKDDGLLVLAVPAFRFLWSPHDESLSHMRRYDRKDFEALAQDGGFEIQRSGFLFFTMFLPVAVVRMIRKVFVKTAKPQSDTFSNPSSKVNEWLLRLLGWEARFVLKVPWPFGTSVYIVAKHKKRQ
jgi:dolichyl-phosphate beta-glucosyltransferase